MYGAILCPKHESDAHENVIKEECEKMSRRKRTMRKLKYDWQRVEERIRRKQRQMQQRTTMVQIQTKIGAVITPSDALQWRPRRPNVWIPKSPSE